MKKWLKKRGLSTVITTLILIAVSIVVIVGVGIFIKNFTEEEADFITADGLTLDVQIMDVEVLSDTNMSVKVKRNPGGNNIVGVIFVVYDENNTEVHKKNVPLEELERKDFEIILQVLNTSYVHKITVSPIYETNSGKEVISPVEHERIVNPSSGGGSSSGSSDSENPVDPPEIVCDLTSAIVNPSEVLEGDYVLFTIAGNNCVGSLMEYNIFERDDGFLSGSDDPLFPTSEIILFHENSFCNLCIDVGGYWCVEDDLCKEYIEGEVPTCDTGFDYATSIDLCPVGGNSNEYSFLWEAVYQEDNAAFEDPDPEYYFRFDVLGSTEFIESEPDLIVRQLECGGSTGIPCFEPRAYWSYAGSETTLVENLEIPATLTLNLENSGLEPTTNVVFEIYEEDTVGNDYLGSATSNIGYDGHTSVSWVINSTHKEISEGIFEGPLLELFFEIDGFNFKPELEVELIEPAIVVIGPNCSDGIQNQGEFDIDCGGPCGDCLTICQECVEGGGYWCIPREGSVIGPNDEDLPFCGTDFNACIENDFLPRTRCETCFDGIRNQNEEQTDCGGPNCDPCPGCLMNLGFDEGSGFTAYDSCGDNDGTLNPNFDGQCYSEFPDGLYYWMDPFYEGVKDDRVLEIGDGQSFVAEYDSLRSVSFSFTPNYGSSYIFEIKSMGFDGPVIAETLSGGYQSGGWNPYYFENPVPLTVGSTYYITLKSHWERSIPTWGDPISDSHYFDHDYYPQGVARRSGVLTNDDWVFRINYNTNCQSPWRPEGECISGGCLEFDGVEDIIVVPDDVTLNPDEITVMAWVKTDHSQAWGSGFDLINKNSRSCSGGYGLGAYSGPIGGEAVFATHTEGDCIGRGGTTNVRDGEWHHLVGTYNGHESRVYVDGILERRLTSPEGPILDYTKPLLIGGEDIFPVGYMWFHRGYMDEIRIYDHAITYQEVVNYYGGDVPSINYECYDGILNQNEQEIDCGGPCESCPTCYDGILNQDEEETDCGGICNPCPTCTDGIQNQGEDRIDCGGPYCSACPTCYDGIQNQGEEDIDCGSPCAPCPDCSDQDFGNDIFMRSSCSDSSGVYYDSCSGSGTINERVCGSSDSCEVITSSCTSGTICVENLIVGAHCVSDETCGNGICDRGEVPACVEDCGNVNLIDSNEGIICFSEWNPLSTYFTTSRGNFVVYEGDPVEIKFEITASVEDARLNYILCEVIDGVPTCDPERAQIFDYTLGQSSVIWNAEKSISGGAYTLGIYNPHNVVNNYQTSVRYDGDIAWISAYGGYDSEETLYRFPEINVPSMGDGFNPLLLSVISKPYSSSCCGNEQMDCGETGIDCGGPCDYCSHCDNEVQDQDEVGVDCGGSCRPCTYSDPDSMCFSQLGVGSDLIDAGADVGLPFAGRSSDIGAFEVVGNCCYYPNYDCPCGVCLEEGSTEEPCQVLIDDLEPRINDLINVERANNGLSPLSFSSELSNVARTHSQDMADNMYFQHDSLDGTTFSERISNAGISCSMSAENIFALGIEGRTPDELAEYIVQGWMDSPGHRENILTAPLTSQGIGVAESEGTWIYITEDFCA